MLEGKEVEKKIGEYGTASVDVTSEGKVKIEVSIEVDLVAEAEKLAKKTKTEIDDKAIAWLKLLMGRSDAAPVAEESGN